LMVMELLTNSSKNFYDVRGIYVDAYPAFGTPDDVRIIDFNGDKKQEMLVIKGTASRIYEYDITSESFSQIYYATTFPLSTDRIYPGDFNGDKKTDILYWRSGSGWALKFSSGTGFVTSANPPALYNTDPGASTTDHNYYISDFNGDGKADIAESNKLSSPSVLKLFYSTGIAFATAESNSFPKSTINQGYFLIGDFNGDGKKDIFYYDNSSTANYVYLRFFHKDEIKHFVNFVSNGFGENTGINYNRINDNSAAFYVTGSGAAFPAKDYNGPLYVVQSLWSFNSATDSTTNRYFYDKAIFHQQGKGFLGFMKNRSELSKQLFYQTQKFSYDPTYFYVSRDSTENKTTIYDLGQTTIFTNQIYSYGNKRIRPYISHTENWDDTKMTWKITDYTYDSYNNILNSSTTYRNQGLTTEIENYNKYTYGSYGNWGIPNKVITSTDSTIYTYESESEYVRKASFQYDSNGNQTVVITDPGKSKAVRKTSFYNEYGLVKRDSVSASGLISRVTKFEYDSKKRFVTTTINALNHSSTATYSSATGNILTTTDVNNKTTSYSYDSFGNLIQVTDPLGVVTTRSIYWDELPVNHPADYIITSHRPGTPDQSVTFSGSGQKKLVMTMGMEGYINEQFNYNSRGQISMKKGPHSNNDWSHAPVVNYSYDDFGRIYSITDNHGFTSYYYNGRTIRISYPVSKTKESTVNALGDVISIRENYDNNLITTYHYASNGKVKQVNSAGTTVSMAYDEYANLISSTNPNFGTDSTRYDAFGQKIYYRDPKPGSYFSFEYDTIGRISTFTSPDGETQYRYNHSGTGIEQLESVTAPNDVSYSYDYDDYGRLVQYTEEIEAGQSLSTSYTYGAHGTDSTITYPGGFQIKKLYQNGYLREIQRSNGALIWRLDSVSPFGGPKKYTLGSNGLLTRFIYDDHKGYLQKKTTGIRQQTFTFDTITGNLMVKGFRQGYNRSESYTYDNLDRLTGVTGQGRNPASMNYSSNGNISSRSYIGSYYYNEDKINAVDSISNDYGEIMPGPQNIEYTYFNKVSSILDSIDKDLYSLSITYGPDQQRVKNVFGKNGDVIKTKYYSPGFEKEVTASTTREISYISSPYGLVAINIRQNSADSLYFVDTDHLGSILSLLRNNGTQAAEYSYDEWGRRRRPTNWTLYDSIPYIGFIDRGYTGHEHYDIFGLIDMNGRVYDPVIGRFLSPDPFIQAPDFTQSYNSYSYCFNNPLNYTDPSGNVAAVTIPREDWSKFLFDANHGASVDQLIKDYGERDYYNVFEMNYGGTVGGLRGMLSELYGGMFYDVFLADYSKKELSKTYIEKLGNDGSFITFIAHDIRSMNKYGYPGEIQLEVRVYSKSNKYSDYNFIQSAYKDVKGWFHDSKDQWDGFVNSPSYVTIYKSEYYLRGGNAYYEDSPNTNGATDFQLTICGRQERAWEAIQTYKWGYSINNKIIDYYFDPCSPFGFHAEDIINTLIFENNRLKK
jgi:RHS repeat-associated protein